ncbi:GH39 family glycosyl hydrolase [Lacisediminihabitans changchengi]|uniref:Discoidin domain-containing protein n=1 Tax=Lacisediminihabitans changchengi TaxID=2787634 RepID=A0A934W128_9MICO|nr:discoidin domain-containing protein [Lacisediminihabitans changchengi]MBK4346443.1 discoidin domain-containing protein [Lacisediminihabitans changchengi]MBK4348929.1 discoidin domain-containing protein [Lacisediminihabitans changchengi]
MRNNAPAPTLVRRALRTTRVAACVALIAAIVAGCTSPTPTPTPKLTASSAPVAAQPPFTRTPISQTTPETSTATSTTSTLAADYTKANGTVDQNVLMNASQGGYAPMQNMNWFPAQAAQMSSMGLRDIRIDHVFDDNYYHVVNIAADGKATFDFTNLDRVVLPLVRNGMTPFFSLSYSPSVSGKALYKAPVSTEIFAAASGALVAHYKAMGMSGRNWEVWNEIDSLYTYTGTIEQYEALYAATVAAVKAADSTAQVGGAATSTIGELGGWSSRFLQWLTANPTVPADFFSYHSYYIGDFSDGPKAQAWLKATGRNIPIYITEWNSNPASGLGVGQGSDTNSSVSGSSYVAKRLYTAIGAGAAKIFWFGPLEGANPSKAYLGDLGLITMDGHRKSVGNVFEMYSHLDPTRIAATIAGAGTDTKDVFGLMTKNPTKKKATLLLWNNTAVDSTMAVSLTKLPYSKSNFEISQTMVSDHKGNSFADTSTAVDYRYPSPNENAPVISDTIVAGASAYKKSIRIPAHGITELTFTPSTKKAQAATPVAQPSNIDLAASGAGSTVTTTSSSAEVPIAGWGTANLIDGRRISVPWVGKGAEGWSSAGHADQSATESARVDFGKSRAVDSVVMWSRNSAGHEGEGFPSDFTIKGSSDNATWTDLSAVTNYHAKTTVIGPQTFTFEPKSVRYLKVEATKLARPSSENGASVYHFQLTELEAYRNGLSNGGFEGTKLSPWKARGSAKVQSLVVHGGNAAVALTKAGSRLTYAVAGLTPGTTYTVGGYVRSSATGGGMTLQAGSSAASTVSPKWAATWVTFTTAKGQTTADLTITKTGGGTGWADDLTMTSKTGQN